MATSDFENNDHVLLYRVGQLEHAVELKAELKDVQQIAEEVRGLRILILKATGAISVAAVTFAIGFLELATHLGH